MILPTVNEWIFTDLRVKYSRITRFCLSPFTLKHLPGRISCLPNECVIELLLPAFFNLVFIASVPPGSDCACDWAFAATIGS